MARKRSMSSIGWESLHSNLLDKPDSGIPSVRSREETTNSAMHSRNTCAYEVKTMASTLLALSPTMSALAVPRTLFPYLHRIVHPKILKFMGQIAPCRSLNHVIKLADIINANARGIYETKKTLLQSGDDATVKQVGDGNDIISLLSASV